MKKNLVLNQNQTFCFCLDKTVEIMEIIQEDGTKIYQITETIKDLKGKKVIRRVTKRRDSKINKITFEPFPENVPKDVISIEQIEVMPEKDVKETVVIEVMQQIVEESGKKIVKKIKMKQTKPEEVTFETLPDLLEKEKTIVEEIEVIPDVRIKQEVQVTHSVTEETGKRLLKRITKRKTSISEVTFESIKKIIKPESIAQEVIEVLPEKDVTESVSVEIIETIIDKTGKKVVKKVIKKKEIVPRDASFNTLRDIIYSQDDESVDLKRPKKVMLKEKKEQEEIVEVIETVDDKGKKIIKKITKSKPEIVQGFSGKFCNFFVIYNFYISFFPSL